MAQSALLSIPLIALILLTGCTEPLGERLEGDAVLRLYRDQTAVGHHHRKDFEFQRYFAPDGRLETWNTRHGHRRGQWRVSDDGRHCVKMARAEEHCRDIYLGADGIYRKYGWVWYGYHLLISYQRFQPGRHL